MRAIILAALAMLLVPAPAVSAELPPGFVRLADVAPSIRQEMRYAGTENFIGRPVEGYDVGDCWLAEPVAQALAKVAAEAEAGGWRLVVYDCYRPERAVRDFLQWSRDPSDQTRKSEYYPDIDKADLFRAGYIATRSQHSSGTTVDLGPERLVAGEVVPLDFGTPFDTFSPFSSTASREVSAAAQGNRRRLVELMIGQGFENYSKEWWHFTLPLDPSPPAYDLPITP
jgi:zinc D-Ala-D-Ala dipeptidase